MDRTSRVGSIEGVDCFPAEMPAEAHAFRWGGAIAKNEIGYMQNTERTDNSLEKHIASGRRKYMNDFCRI
jgi:hypothetical protein